MSAHDKTLRVFFGWLYPHRKQLYRITLVSIGIVILQLCEPLFAKFIIDNVLLKPGGRAIDIQVLNIAGVFLLACIFISHTLTLLREFWIRKCTIFLSLGLRRRILQTLMQIPYKELSNYKTKAATTRLSVDVEQVVQLLRHSIVTPLQASVRLTVSLIVLFLFNWKMGFVACALIPFAVFLSYLSSGRVRPLYRRIRECSEVSDTRVAEAASAMRLVRVFGMENNEICAFMFERRRIARLESLVHRRESFLWCAWALLASLTNGAVIWGGGALYAYGEISIGTIIATQWYVFALLTPISAITTSFIESHRIQSSVERLIALFDRSAGLDGRLALANAPAAIEKIEFKNVVFSYAPDNKVLNEISFCVRRGQQVALVGSNGAGKSTIIDLLLGLQTPDSGSIEIDGCELSSYKLSSLRERFAVVHQDVLLLDRTVLENISYGCSKRSFNDVIRIANELCIHDFITSLPEGYKTIIGERGGRLSGGQRQKLAIARALLRDPQVLVLDEATSSLDSHSEEIVSACIARRRLSSITIIIAHRLPTAESADVVVFIQRGRVVAVGTHLELMSHGGEYLASFVPAQKGSTHDNGAQSNSMV